MGTLRDIYDIIKELKNLVNEYQNEEMSNKVILIQEAFFDIREEIEDVKEENRHLKDIIRQMQDNSDIEKDLELTPQGYYIRKSDTNGTRYCPACWNKENLLMPIVNTIGNAHQCCNCKLRIR